MMELKTIRRDITEKWESGRFFEHGIDLTPYRDLDLPWVPYEDYMEAQLEEVVIGGRGKLRIRFKPNTAEDSRMHTHPDSERIVTILKGSGKFVAERHGHMFELSLKAGDRIWMPRNTLHNFYAGTKGLLVQSIHCPWIPLEDPRCFVHQK